MQPQRAKFGEEGGGRVSGSLNREGHWTQTKLHVWRQEWGHLRVSVNLLLSLAKDVLSRLLETGASETEDRWEGGEGPSRASCPLTPPARQKEGTCLPVLKGRGDGEKVQFGHREVQCQDQQNPGL